LLRSSPTMRPPCRRAGGRRLRPGAKVP
jgi:hypothetical protein